MLEIGTVAPDFELPDQNGKLHRLSEYRGKKVVLYFYPKDNTSGCTTQALGFAALHTQFVEKNAVVIGVSKDSVASHKKFEQKNDLPFTLLTDTELVAIQAYEVWGEKKMCGKTGMGIIRSTYIIGEDGKVNNAFAKVKAADNPSRMLKEI